MNYRKELNEEQITKFSLSFPAIKKVEVNNTVGCVYIYGNHHVPRGYFETMRDRFGLMVFGAGGNESDFEWRLTFTEESEE